MIRVLPFGILVFACLMVIGCEEAGTPGEIGSPVGLDQYTEYECNSAIQDIYDKAYAEGVASVDITSDNQEA